MKRFFTLVFLICTSFFICASDYNQIGNILKNAEKFYVDSSHNFIHVKYCETFYSTRIVPTYVYAEFSTDPNHPGFKYKYLDTKLDTLPSNYEFCYMGKTIEKHLTRADFKLAKIPVPVYNRYLFGCKLMKSGWITFSIGTCVGIIGATLYSIRINNYNYNYIPGVVPNVEQNNLQTQLHVAGAVLLGCSGTIIGVSIPLLCFGDNTKREANTLFETYNILK